MPKWGLAGLGVIASIVGIAAVQPDLADLDQRVTVIEERLATRPLATVEAQGMRFEGEAGDIVSESFTLNEGTALFTFDVQPETIALISLLPAPGTGESGLVSIVMASAPERGTVAQPIFEAGVHILQVQADGPWSVVLEQ